MSLTPIVGVTWVNNLRNDAQTGQSDVFHSRFDTRDNPGADPAFIKGVVDTFRHQPRLIDLRLGGFPVAMEGLVYNDLIFTPEHVIEPCMLPGHWTRFRVIDPSWRNCACTWWAVSPREEDYILYRDYIGHGLTVSQNCAAIRALSRSEQFARTWIDRHYCSKHEEVHGEKIIELYRKAGVACVESADIGIIPGVLDTWELLTLRQPQGGPEAWRTPGRPRFRVFRTCQNFLNERLKYKWPEAREQGNEGGQENPIDRDNHTLKCFAYFWAARPRWVAVRPPPAPPGSMQKLIQDDRLRTMRPKGTL